MSRILANARNFLLNTDYSLDKVVFQKTYSVTVAGFNFNDVTYAHGLGFTPLVSAQWSTSATMIPTYSISGGPQTYPTGISSDSTNIYISTTNNTASTIALYFTVYGFMPSGVNADVAFTKFSSDSFGFNSDYNYSKLYLSNQFSVSSGTSTRTVAHNLGYVPQVAAWVERSSRTSPFIFNDVVTSVPPFDQINIYTDSTNLYAEFLDILSAKTVHYRIYLDD